MKRPSARTTRSISLSSLVHQIPPIILTIVWAHFKVAVRKIRISKSHINEADTAKTGFPK